MQHCRLQQILITEQGWNLSKSRAGGGVRSERGGSEGAMRRG